jgi:hypothetical protein
MRSPQWLAVPMLVLLLSSPVSSAIVEVKGHDSKAVTAAIEGECRGYRPTAGRHNCASIPTGRFESICVGHSRSL